VVDVHPERPLGGGPQNWNPEDVIPELQHVGPATDEDRAVGRAFRDGLVRNLDFWRRQGLSEPPAIEGLFHFSDQDEITVQEMLQQLNPDLPDVLLHMQQQYDALLGSEFAVLVRGLESRGHLARLALQAVKRGLGRGDSGPSFLKPLKGLRSIEAWTELPPSPKPLDARAWYRPESHLLDEFFDFYCQLRYGFAVPDTRLAILAGYRLNEVMRLSEGDEPEFDNAYYARFYRLDMRDLLYPARSQDTDRPIEWARVVNMASLRSLEYDASVGFARRMVILPRTTQKAGDTVVTTLRDQTVGDHELGHHINHSLADGRGLHRLVDEVMADYLSAAASDNPIIGGFFARASAEISRRLKAEDPSGEDEYMAQAFDQMAAQGHLRDMSGVYDLNSLQRVFFQEDDYSAGNPLRKMLWSIRQQAGDQRDDFDRLALKAVRHFSHLPATTSPYSWAKLHLHTFFSQAYLAWRVNVKTQRYLRSMPEIEDILARVKADPQMVKFAQERVDLEMEERETNGDYRSMTEEEADARRAKERAEALQETFDYLAMSLLSSLAHDKRQQAARDVLSGYAELEERISGLRRFLQKWVGFRFGKSPMSAEYVSSQFARVLYAEARRAGHDRLSRLVRQEAEKALQSGSIVVRTFDGTDTLVFASGINRFNPLVRGLLEQALSGKERLERELMVRSHLERRISRVAEIPDGAYDWLSDVATAKTRDLLPSYWIHLDKLQEFERTGRFFSLLSPHFWIRTGEWAFDIYARSASASMRELQCRELF
jgi:hypothetical protein